MVRILFSLTLVNMPELDASLDEGQAIPPASLAFFTQYCF